MKADALVGRLAASVGPAVFERPEDLPHPPAPRETWVDLQDQVVQAAADADPDTRRRLAAALLHAVLHQPSYGPSNRLSDDAFALLLGSVPDELEAALDRGAGHLYGGRRHLLDHLWGVPGQDGARWLYAMAVQDPTAVGFRIQDMRVGKIARWADADWPARLAALAALPADPRPYPLGLVALLEPPDSALPALVRLALAHGTDRTDHLVRRTAETVAAARTGDPEQDRMLVDWTAVVERAGLGRWLLELAGGPGDRAALVAAAARAGQLEPVDADLLAAPLVRPAWADGEVPWTLDVVALGIATVRLPDGRLSGGDPWWTGGAEGIPWTLAVPVGEYPVDVVVADHPLAPPECAALRLTVVTGASPVRWELVPDRRGDEDSDGYSVEVGVASFGATGVYDAAVVHDAGLTDVVPGAQASWESLDGGARGSLVMCTVGPQHQECRTWAGHDQHGNLVAVVTDLGLLDPDPGALWHARG